MNRITRYGTVSVLTVALLASLAPVGAQNQSAEPEPAPLAAESEPYPDDGRFEDPCRDVWERAEAAFEELRKAHDHEWAEFERERQAFYESNRTQQEQNDFEARMEQRRVAMEERHRAEWDEKQRHYDAECETRIREMEEKQRSEPQRPRPGATGPRDRPPASAGHGPGPGDHPGDPKYGDAAQPASQAGWNDPCAGLHEEFEGRFREVGQRFEAEWRSIHQEYDAFYQNGNFTPDEERAFQERMRDREDQLRKQEEAAFRAVERELRDRCDERVRAQMEKERDRRKADEERHFNEEMRRAPPEMRAAMEQMHALQKECEETSWTLEQAFQDKMQAHWDAYEGPDADRRTADTGARSLERAFEEEMRRHWDECDARMRAFWDTNVGAAMKNGEDYERMGSWSMEERDGQVQVHGKYMSFSAEPEESVITRVSVSGQTYLSAIETDSEMVDGEMDDGDRGSVLRVYGEGLKILFHDNPAGLIHFQADGGYTVSVGVLEGFRVERVGSGWALSNGDARALLRTTEADTSYDESTRTFRISGEAAFLIPGQADNKVLDKVANKHRSEIMDAVEQRRVGAEITVLADDDGAAVDDTLIFDAVEVKVEKPKKAGSALEVTVSSDALEEGKTFVVNVDTKILSLAQKVDVLYFDIDEQTGEERPAEIRRASSLSDVLDASDDEGAEYWLVEDLDGFQVLFSVPHWSTHKVKVQSGDAVEDPGFGSIPAPGLVATLVLVSLAAAAVGMRRRE